MARSPRSTTARRFWERPIVPSGLRGSVLLLTCTAVIAFWLLHPLVAAHVWPDRSYWQLLVSDVPRPAGVLRLLVTAALIGQGLLVAWATHRAAVRTVNQAVSEARALFDGLGDALVCCDRDLRVLWANRAAAMIAGRSPEELVGERCCTLFEGNEPHEDCPAVRTLATGEPHEKMVELADGRVLRVRSHALLGEDGEPVGVIEAGQDVTELHRALREAQDRTELLDALVSTIPQPIVFCDDRDVVRGCNTAFAETILGQPAVAAVGRPLTELRGDLPEPLLRACRARANPDVDVEPREVRVACADGIERDFVLYVQAFGPTDQLQSGRLLVMQDVTAMRQAQDELAERNALIEAMFVNLPVGVAVYKASTGQVRYANPVYSKLAGWEGADGVPVEALFRGVYAETAYRRTMRRRILAEMPREDPGRWRRIETVDGGGAHHVIEMTRLPLLAEDMVLALARDVTAEAQAEQQLERSRARYRQLVEALGEGVWLLDNDGVTTYANPRLGEMLGTTEYELVGRAARDFVADGDAPRLREAMAALGTDRATDEFELSLRRRDGTTLLARILMRPAVDDDGRKMGVIAAVSDVTEQRRLEEQMRRVSRMEAVGRLAAGVAHDFNSILQVINGTAELLLLDASDDDHLWREDVAQILRAGREGAALTSQLRMLSREQDVELHPVHLSKVVREREDLLRRLLPENVDLRVEQVSEPPLVLGDAVQLGQVLLNLVANARDAMPGGGVVTVRTRAHDLREPVQTAFGKMAAGPYACLEVADTGIGIPSELQPRIFEPFFTTKTPEKGTGLGLSQVYGVVRALNGHVTVDSAPGKGTVFAVYLPAVADAAPTAEPASANGQPISGQETVLVVEDDPGVCGLASRVLSRLGYRVLTATGRRGALALARECAGHIDLLLADVIMPETSGPALARELAHELPGLRTLFMSGYNHEMLDHTLQGCPEASLLRKPFTAEQLGQAVRAALDATPT